MSTAKATITEMADAVSVTPTDTTAITGQNDRDWNRVMVGVAGNVTLYLQSSGGPKRTVLLPALIAGGWHMCPPFKGIESTGTTATSIVIGVTL